MSEETPLKRVDELSFEEALEELESLTAAMASGTVTLKESVSGYERGMALLARCRNELDSARKTIERLRRENDAAGKDNVFDEGVPF